MASVICFHRLTHGRPSTKWGVSVSQATDILTALVLRGAKFVPVSEIHDYHEAQLTYAVCSDDGYESDLILAELCKSLEIPLTLFLNPASLDHSMYLKTADVIMLRKMGCTIASHGFSHVDFRRCSAPELRHQIQDSLRALRDISGETVTMLAYPWGLYNARTLVEMRKASLRIGFAARDGCVSKQNKLQTPRMILRTSESAQSLIRRFNVARKLTASESLARAALRDVPWLRPQT